MELKLHLHKMIDGIQSEKLLRILYDFLKIREGSEPGQLWDSLTEAQKQELFLSYKESEVEDKLVEKNKVLGSGK